MVRLSNNMIGCLNVLTFIISIPILCTGIWIRNRAASDCDRFLEKPLIALGVFVMLVSIAGIIGACCRVSCLLWLYLFVMFLLIVLLFCFTIFAFVVTNKGAGKVLSGKGYKDHRLGDYSNWLQKRVSTPENWSKIRSCLVDSNVCTEFNTKYLRHTLEHLYTQRLSPIESGCCMPSDECNFTYVGYVGVGPTRWSKTGGNYTDPDCNVWDDKASSLCFDCESCKAGVLDNIKRDWKKTALLNTVLTVVLIIVYSIGCCAFRNNRHHNSWRQYP